MHQLLQVWIGLPQAVWCLVVTWWGGGFADCHMHGRLIFKALIQEKVHGLLEIQYR